MELTPEIKTLMMLSISELRETAKYHSVKIGSRSIYAIMAEIEVKQRMVNAARRQWARERANNA